MFSLSYFCAGKNLEYGLKQEGLLSFVRELNGNDEEQYDNYLRDASMYARGNYLRGPFSVLTEADREEL